MNKPLDPAPPNPEQEPSPNSPDQSRKDSLGIPMNRSPWGLFAVIQVVVAVGMGILIWVMYSFHQGAKIE